MRDLTRRTLANYRPLTLEALETKRPAAVMLLLHEQAGIEHVLFQVRTQRVRFHKGEISLPGGGVDPEDATHLDAALRETHEELGVVPHHIEVLGRLDDLHTRSGFAVTPFVGAITEPGPYPFALANREVAELLTVPLPHLRSDAALEWVERDLEGERWHERQYWYGEHRIWGVTARILSNYFDVLATGEASAIGEASPVAEAPAAARPE